MSWSVFTNAAKNDAEQAIDALQLDGVHGAWAVDQLQTAKRAAKELLKGVPGPYVTINLAGHANGVGWNAKDGMSNDTITVSVYQQTEELK